MITQPRDQGKDNSPHRPAPPMVVGHKTPETHAMVPPLPPGTPATALDLAFSRPCPYCHTIVSLPWCTLLTAVLDRIDLLEELPGEIAVLHARVGWLDAIVHDLQGHDEEGRP